MTGVDENVAEGSIEKQRTRPRENVTQSSQESNFNHDDHETSEKNIRDADNTTQDGDSLSKLSNVIESTTHKETNETSDTENVTQDKNETEVLSHREAVPESIENTNLEDDHNENNKKDNAEAGSETQHGEILCVDVTSVDEKGPEGKKEPEVTIVRETVPETSQQTNVAADDETRKENVSDADGTHRDKFSNVTELTTSPSEFSAKVHNSDTFTNDNDGQDKMMESGSVASVPTSDTTGSVTGSTTGKDQFPLCHTSESKYDIKDVTLSSGNIPANTDSEDDDMPLSELQQRFKLERTSSKVEDNDNSEYEWSGDEDLVRIINAEQT